MLQTSKISNMANQMHHAIFEMDKIGFGVDRAMQLHSDITVVREKSGNFFRSNDKDSGIYDGVRVGACFVLKKIVIIWLTFLSRFSLPVTYPSISILMQLLLYGARGFHAF